MSFQTHQASVVVSGCIIVSCAFCSAPASCKISLYLGEPLFCVTSVYKAEYE